MDLNGHLEAWFDKLKGNLISWGYFNSVSNTSLFYAKKFGRMILILIYVDVILIIGESSTNIQ